MRIHGCQDASVRWMKLSLRAAICRQCHPGAMACRGMEFLAPYSCESDCSLFVQLPRLAQFLLRHGAKPPAGYEDFALKMLADSSTAANSHLEYSAQALAILERVAALFTAT